MFGYLMRCHSLKCRKLTFHVVKELEKLKEGRSLTETRCGRCEAKTHRIRLDNGRFLGVTENEELHGPDKECA